jgi:hypothetical protein
MASITQKPSDLAVLEHDTASRATRAALFLAVLEAQRADWLDVVDGLAPLLQIADQRIRAEDYGVWLARLHTEGPNQVERLG